MSKTDDFKDLFVFLLLLRRLEHTKMRFSTVLAILYFCMLCFTNRGDYRDIFFMYYITMKIPDKRIQTEK
jgi:hypothetical protein